MGRATPDQPRAMPDQPREMPAKELESAKPHRLHSAVADIASREVLTKTELESHFGSEWRENNPEAWKQKMESAAKKLVVMQHIAEKILPESDPSISKIIDNAITIGDKSHNRDAPRLFGEASIGIDDEDKTVRQSGYLHVNSDKRAEMRNIDTLLEAGYSAAILDSLANSDISGTGRFIELLQNGAAFYKRKTNEGGVFLFDVARVVPQTKRYVPHRLSYGPVSLDSLDKIYIKQYEKRETFLYSDEQKIDILNTLVVKGMLGAKPTKSPYLKQPRYLEQLPEGILISEKGFLVMPGETDEDVEKKYFNLRDTFAEQMLQEMGTDAPLTEKQVREQLREAKKGEQLRAEESVKDEEPPVLTEPKERKKTPMDILKELEGTNDLGKSLAIIAEAELADRVLISDMRKGDKYEKASAVSKAKILDDLKIDLLDPNRDVESKKKVSAEYTKFVKEIVEGFNKTLAIYTERYEKVQKDIEEIKRREYADSNEALFSEPKDKKMNLEGWIDSEKESTEFKKMYDELGQSSKQILKDENVTFSLAELEKGEVTKVLTERLQELRAEQRELESSDRQFFVGLFGRNKRRMLKNNSYNKSFVLNEVSKFITPIEKKMQANADRGDNVGTKIYIERKKNELEIIQQEIDKRKAIQTSSSVGTILPK